MKIVSLGDEVAAIEKQVAATMGDVSALTNSIEQKKNEIAEIRHPLEQYRMKWLFGALAIVVIGLLFANISAKRKSEGWVLCNIRNWCWGCWASLHM